MGSANFFSGGIYTFKSNITSYFSLRDQNEILIEENIRLRERLEGLKTLANSTAIDSGILPLEYKYFSSEVINNNYSKTKNTLTINKGSNDSIKIDMGVISSKGIIGIVNKVSKNYATVQSILNTNSQINARLKNSSHFGSLEWDTNEPNIVQLNEVNRLAPVKVGDTIITGGKSTIFPDGILIGTIKEFKIGENDNYDLDVLLFNDMTNLKHVYVIENTNAREILELEKGDADAEQ
tara:strand:- start:84583 stop:85293 length:711 start_codon:yes stop_codon:yes gene_type:complete